MSQLEYHLTFPRQYVRFDEKTVTFSICHIRSRFPSVLYFRLYGYDVHENLIYSYTSPRWIINNGVTDDGKPIFDKRTRTFDIDDTIYEDIAYTQIELVTIGISSENPLYFNNVIFNNGRDIGYCKPNQRESKTIGFKNTRYCNLYDVNGNYLQVIRPNADSMMTDVLTKCGCTVIAPHLENESDIDDPINIFYEFINQVEQRIDVLR